VPGGGVGRGKADGHVSRNSRRCREVCSGCKHEDRCTVNGSACLVSGSARQVPWGDVTAAPHNVHALCSAPHISAADTNEMQPISHTSNSDPRATYGCHAHKQPTKLPLAGGHVTRHFHWTAEWVVDVQFCRPGASMQDVAATKCIQHAVGHMSEALTRPNCSCARTCTATRLLLPPVPRGLEMCTCLLPVTGLQPTNACLCSSMIAAGALTLFCEQQKERW
jgi:hypothetical protein